MLSSRTLDIGIEELAELNSLSINREVDLLHGRRRCRLPVSVGKETMASIHVCYRIRKANLDNHHLSLIDKWIRQLAFLSS
jgi:hypothetical protein